MNDILKKIWPFIIIIVLFLCASWYGATHIEWLRSVLAGDAMWFGMSLYLLLGVVTVVIPFGSLLPFIPIAVSLWGWEATAVLTLLAWVGGGQILFEFGRSLHSSVPQKFLSRQMLEKIETMLDRNDLIHAVMVRLIIHDDSISIAFGALTKVSRWKFTLITALGVLPTAIIYSYLGQLPWRYQIAIIFIAVFVLGIYWGIRNINRINGFFSRKRQ